MDEISVFDIAGPIMVGPSSSHTAGACKIGQFARALFHGTPKKATFYLHGSFGKVYKGHATDRALLAGVLKFRTSDPRIKNSFTILSKEFDTVIIEGIGGALVPYNTKDLVIDIAKELDLPVIIVAKNKLGAINHTLLTIEAIRARNMKILGLIFNSHENEDKIIADDNPEIIKTLTNEKILGNLPLLKERTLLQKAFRPIGDNILNASTKGLGNE